MKAVERLIKEKYPNVTFVRIRLLVRCNCKVTEMIMCIVLDFRSNPDYHILVGNFREWPAGALQEER